MDCLIVETSHEVLLGRKYSIRVKKAAGQTGQTLTSIWIQYNVTCISIKKIINFFKVSLPRKTVASAC